MLKTVLQASPCRWLTGEGHLPAVPTPTDRAGPGSYCLWQGFRLQRPCELQKAANFLQMHAKINHLYSTEGHETGVKRT